MGGVRELRARMARGARKGERGMTLLEIMIVIAILGMLASVIVVAVMDRLTDAKVKTTQIKIKSIESALHQYKVMYGNYPTQAEGLRSLISPPSGGRPFLKDKNVPRDEFGNEFLFFNPARKGGGLFEVMSKGPDGQEGTEDDIRAR